LHDGAVAVGHVEASSSVKASTAWRIWLLSLLRRAEIISEGEGIGIVLKWDSE
jgi:hypothetical protein